MKANRNPPPRPWHGSSIWRVVLTLAAVVALVTTEYLIVPSAAQNLQVLAPTGAGQAQGTGTVDDTARLPAMSAADPTTTQDDAEAIGRSIAAY